MNRCLRGGTDQFNVAVLGVVPPYFREMTVNLLRPWLSQPFCSPLLFSDLDLPPVYMKHDLVYIRVIAKSTSTAFKFVAIDVSGKLRKSDLIDPRTHPHLSSSGP